MARVTLSLLLAALAALAAAHGQYGQPARPMPPMRPPRPSPEDKDDMMELKWVFEAPEPRDPPSQYGGYGEDDKPVPLVFVETSVAPVYIQVLQAVKLAFESAVPTFQTGNAKLAVDQLRLSVNSLSDLMEATTRDIHALTKRALKHNGDICQNYFATGIEYFIELCLRRYVEGVNRFLGEQLALRGAVECNHLEEWAEFVKRENNYQMPEVNPGLVRDATQAFGLDVTCVAANLGAVLSLLQDDTLQLDRPVTATDVLVGYSSILKHLNEGLMKKFKVANSLVCHHQYVDREVGYCPEPKQEEAEGGMRRPGGDDPTGGEEEGEEETDGSGDDEGDNEGDDQKRALAQLLRQHQRRSKGTKSTGKSKSKSKSTGSTDAPPTEGETPAIEVRKLFQ